MQWIRRQCESGFAYGVFTVSEATAAGELAPTTPNMVYRKPRKYLLTYHSSLDSFVAKKSTYIPFL